mgnify:CR=1 FL=1
MSRPRILCISLSEFARDGRVLRQLGVLTGHGDVTTVGFGPAPAGVVEHLEVPALPTLPQTPSGVLNLALHRFGAVELAAPAVRAALALVGDRSFDLVVANEARALGLAFAVAHGAPVWGDMHEYSPKERDHIPTWRLLVAPFMTHLCRTYLPRCAAVTTVSEDIVSEYQAVFGVRPELVRNARPFVDLTPGEVLPDGPVRLAHSGIALHGRGIDLLIRSVQRSTGLTLDLFLVPAGDGGRHLAALHELAGGDPRITFHDPVAPDDLPRALNPFDIGVFAMKPSNFNMEHALPNKLFDFLQARLGMVVTPNSEMRRFVQANDLGVVATGYDAEAFQAALASLDREAVTRYKQSAHRHAHTLSNATDLAVSNAIVERLLATGP